MFSDENQALHAIHNLPGGERVSCSRDLGALRAGGMMCARRHFFVVFVQKEGEYPFGVAANAQGTVKGEVGR